MSGLCSSPGSDLSDELRGWHLIDVLQRVAFSFQLKLNIGQKVGEPIPDDCSSRKITAKGRAKPVAKFADKCLEFVFVSFNVVAGYVRKCLLIPVSLPFENQDLLVGLVFSSENATAEVDAQFEWHVESRQSAFAGCLHSGNIMNAEPTRPDQVDDFLQSDFTRIGAFGGNSGLQPAFNDSEEDRSK